MENLHRGMLLLRGLTLEMLLICAVFNNLLNQVLCTS